MEGQSCQLLTEDRWMTLLPKGPFEFWQAGFRSPSPPLMVPGRRLFTDTVKVIPSADTGICEDWNTLSCRLLEIMCRQFKSLRTTLTEYYFCSCIVSILQGSWIDGELNLQHTGKHMEQMATRGKRTLTWPLVGCQKTSIQQSFISSFRRTSAPTSPFCCDNVSHLQMPAAFNTHRQAVFPL